MKKKIAIFASGSGSNAENIIRYFQESTSISVIMVATNKADAYVLERAKNLNVPTYYFPKAEWTTAENIVGLLHDLQIDWVVLAGFLLHIPQSLIEAFPQRIINIHPSLLPKFGGKGMYGGHVHEAVVAAGEQESGITIHYVNEHYDEGTVIFQATCPVYPTDTPETVAEKVHALEYRHFPAVIEQLLTENP